MNQLEICAFSNDDFENYCRVQLKNPWFQAMPLDNIRTAVRKTLDEGDSEFFSIFIKETSTYCGNISLQTGPTSGNPEIGIALLEDYQNQGIGTAAIVLFCDYCYTHRGITKLEVRIDPENKRSIHVFEKLGAIFRKKQADYISLLEELCGKIGEPLPNNLDDNLGSLHYDLELPFSYLAKSPTIT